MERLTYTVKEVADLLGISKSYAYQLVKERKLPVLEVGNRRVIPKNQFELWIKESTNKI